MALPLDTVDDKDENHPNRPVSTGEALLRALNLNHFHKNKVIKAVLDNLTGEGEEKGNSLFLTMAAIAAGGAVISFIVGQVADIITEQLPGFGDVGSDNDATVTSLPLPSSIDLPTATPEPRQELQTPAPRPAEPNKQAPVNVGKANRNQLLARPSDNVDNAIRAAAIKESIEYELLYALVGVESSFKSDAQAGTSSAAGLGQFTAGTWDYLTNKVWPELGYGADDRTDPYKASIVASKYIKRINVDLRSVTGGPPSIGQTYLGYFMGPGGAKKFITELKKNPNAIGEELFPKQAKANENIFYRKGKALTLQETMDILEGKITNYYAQAKDNASPSATAIASSAKVARPRIITLNEVAPPVNDTKGVQASNKVVNVGTSEAAPAPTNGRASGTPTAQAITASTESIDVATMPSQQIEVPASQGSGNKIVPGPGAGKRPEGQIIRGKDNRLYAIS